MKQYLKKIPLNLRQFVKFCSVGVLNTIIDTFLYVFFTRTLGVYYLLANVFAFAVSSTNSYYLNKFFTFKVSTGKSPLEYSKFILVLLIGLMIAELVLFISVHFGGLNDIIGKLLSIGLVLFWNFFGSKYFVFKIKR